MKYKSLILLAASLALAGCTQTPAQEEGKHDQSTSTHTVTFNTNGGSEVTSQQVRDGGKITKPDNPTKEGYEFVKRTYQGEEWSFIGYTVTEDMILTAERRVLDYEVVFLDELGRVHYSTTTPYGSDYESKFNGIIPYTFREPVNGQVYVFDGWTQSISGQKVTFTPKFALQDISKANHIICNNKNYYIQMEAHYGVYDEDIGIVTLTDLNKGDRFSLYFGGKMRVGYDFSYNYSEEITFENDEYIVGDYSQLTLRISFTYDYKFKIKVIDKKANCVPITIKEANNMLKTLRPGEISDVPYLIEGTVVSIGAWYVLIADASVNYDAYYAIYCNGGDNGSLLKYKDGTAIKYGDIVTAGGYFKNTKNTDNPSDLGWIGIIEPEFEKKGVNNDYDGLKHNFVIYELSPYYTGIGVDKTYKYLIWQWNDGVEGTWLDITISAQRVAYADVSCSNYLVVCTRPDETVSTMSWEKVYAKTIDLKRNGNYAVSEEQLNWIMSSYTHNS